MPATASHVCHKTASLVKLNEINYADLPVILTPQEYEPGFANRVRILNDSTLPETLVRIQPSYNALPNEILLKCRAALWKWAYIKTIKHSFSQEARNKEIFSRQELMCCLFDVFKAPTCKWQCGNHRWECRSCMHTGGISCSLIRRAAPSVWQINQNGYKEKKALELL